MFITGNQKYYSHEHKLNVSSSITLILLILFDLIKRGMINKQKQKMKGKKGVGFKRRHEERL